MILNISFLDNQLNFSREYINLIEIENKKYFYRIINELFKYGNGIVSDQICFFENNKEINLNNKIKIISDYLNLFADEKKYITEINKNIILELNDNDKKIVLNNYNKIYSIIEKKSKEIDIPLVLNNDFNIDNIFKSFKLSLEIADDLLNNLLLLIDTESILKMNKLLIFVNLKQYLSNEELKELYKYSIYKEINILLIDSQCYGVCKEYEKKLIIDNNLEEIMIK